MDRELVKKYRLEEAVKRFGLINEYIYETFDEADDPNAQDNAMTDNGDAPDAMGDAPDADGGMNSPDPAMGGDDMNAPQMDDNPNAMDGETDGMSNDMGNEPMSQPADPNGEGMPQSDEEIGGEDEDFGEAEPMQDGDEVIDVDDLTSAQEETDYKIDGVDEKLTQLLSIIDKFESSLADNDEKIAELKKELELRNPTPTERLNLRSQAGYPFNVQPKDFWEKKSVESPQYEVDFGNDDNTDSSEREEYILRKGDVRGGNDRSIADSFGEHKLSDYLNF